MKKLLLLLIILSVNCIMTKDIKYKYIDGSGNVYNISLKEFEYKPVQPENSSSGFYSGGQYVLKKIEKAEYNAFKKAVNSAEKNISSQIKERVMMSGMIIIDAEGKKKSFIIDPGADIKKTIEKILTEIKLKP